jgi:hypothetical protein
MIASPEMAKATNLDFCFDQKCDAQHMPFIPIFNPPNQKDAAP